jgi:hypothetical protein
MDGFIAKSSLTPSYLSNKNKQQIILKAGEETCAISVL